MVYVNCCNQGLWFSNNVTSVSWANETVCDYERRERDNVNAMYMFLDLKINTIVFGICSIFIGMYMLTTNY